MTGPAARFALFRDSWGVPHVRAATELDVAYGQGYVTALDRGWQVEVDRWRAEGRLAARFGPAGLEWDRFAVRVRLADTARRVYAALAPPERAWLDAYAAGTSAGLAAGGRDVPERQALARAAGGAPLPADEPWPGWAPIGVFCVNQLLFGSWPHVLWREHVARTLGPTAPAVALAGPDGGPSAGSNAWAVHGSRTASGAPLLAGDPHRLLELPGVYQQVRLACDAPGDDGFDVVGLAFPGVPGVAHFGHAATPGGSVAWGVTNAVAHGTEVVDEEDAPAADRSAGSETVPVRGAAPVQVRWEETPRGPLLTGRHALRWPVRADADAGVPAWRGLQRVRSAHDVAAVLSTWVDPVNRVLAADSTGAVLRLTAGRVPDVPPAGRALPVPAAAAAARGWRVLPAPEHVAAGVAVDANERPDRPDHDLGYAYAAPHRAARIRALLADAPAGGETPASQLRVHADTHDAGAAVLVDLLDGVDDPAADRLRAWVADGARMDPGSRGAALFARWRAALVRRTAAHPALAPLHRPHGLPGLLGPWLDGTARVGDVLTGLLAAGAPRAAGGAVVDPPALAAAALADARLPADDATWGDLHVLAPAHALAEVAAVDSAVRPGDVPGVPAGSRAPLGGSVDTVRCTPDVPGVTHAASRGSVARWVWDLSDRRGSRWGVPFGTSGDPRSPHFADQHATWARGGTVPIETDWARLRPVPLEDP